VVGTAPPAARAIERRGVNAIHRFRTGLEGADVVMMLDSRARADGGQLRPLAPRIYAL